MVQNSNSQNRSMVQDSNSQNRSMVQDFNSQNRSMERESGNQNCSMVRHSDKQNRSMVQESNTQTRSMVRESVEQDDSHSDDDLFESCSSDGDSSDKNSGDPLDMETHEVINSKFMFVVQRPRRQQQQMFDEYEDAMVHVLNDHYWADTHTTELKKKSARRVKSKALYAKSDTWLREHNEMRSQPDAGWLVDLTTFQCPCSYWTKYGICVHVVAACSFTGTLMPNEAHPKQTLRSRNKDMKTRIAQRHRAMQKNFRKHAVRSNNTNPPASPNSTEDEDEISDNDGIGYNPDDDHEELRHGARASEGAEWDHGTASIHQTGSDHGTGSDFETGFDKETEFDDGQPIGTVPRHMYFTPLY
jgi:hypothetical protein